MNQFKSRPCASKTILNDKIRRLVYFVITSAPPFSVVENKNFKLILKEYGDDIPNRRAIKDILKKVHDEITESFKLKIKSVNFLACTSDGWTSRYQKK